MNETEQDGCFKNHFKRRRRRGRRNLWAYKTTFLLRLPLLLSYLSVSLSLPCNAIIIITSSVPDFVLTLYSFRGVNSFPQNTFLYAKVCVFIAYLKFSQMCVISLGDVSSMFPRCFLSEKRE